MSHEANNKPRPIRVLHVVTSLRVGGIQTFLRNVRQRMDREAVAMDFAPYARVQATGEASLEVELEAMGARLLPCAQPERPWRYAMNLTNILREHGPYDVVHAHVAQRAGLVLNVARQCGVPVRIAHAHNDYRAAHAAAPWWWRLYLTVMRRWMDRFASACLACSSDAGRSLYGHYWRSDERYRVLPYGIDLSPFREPLNAEAIRHEVGLPSDVPVIGHVGRFALQKNHLFMLKIFAAVCRQHPTVRLLLVGEGTLRAQVKRAAHEMGLSERLVFAGARADVPQLMRGAMDVFLLPSLHEGLPVVGIEAQAAGLPIVCSDVVTEELAVVPDLVHRLSLEVPAERWAQTMLTILENGRTLSQASALEKVTASPLNIDVCADKLAQLYGGEAIAEVDLETHSA